MAQGLASDSPLLSFSCGFVYRILEDHILTTLKTFEGNVALCAEQLLRIPVEHQQFEYMLVEVGAWRLALVNGVCSVQAAFFRFLTASLLMTSVCSVPFERVAPITQRAGCSPGI